MTNEVGLPRFSKGKRPAFFEEDGVDHLMAMILELATELTVVYSRVDRLEHYLAKAGQLDPQALEDIEIGAEAAEAQDKRRELFLDRLFSSVRQQAAPDQTGSN